MHQNLSEAALVLLAFFLTHCNASGGIPDPRPAYQPCNPGEVCAHGLRCISSGIDASGASTAGNQCSSPCRSDSDCIMTMSGGSAACVFAFANGSSQCYRRCTADADCDPGSTCVMSAGQTVCAPQTGTAPPPTRPAYQACDPSDLCGSGTACITASSAGGYDYPGYFCSRQCSANSDCPVDEAGQTAVCLAGECYQRCAGGASGCDSYSTCTNFGGANLCVPDGSYDSGSYGPYCDYGC